MTPSEQVESFVFPGRFPFLLPFHLKSKQLDRGVKHQMPGNPAPDICRLRLQACGRLARSSLETEPANPPSSVCGLHRVETLLVPAADYRPWRLTPTSTYFGVYLYPAHIPSYASLYSPGEKKGKWVDRPGRSTPRWCIFPIRAPADCVLGSDCLRTGVGEQERR